MSNLDNEGFFDAARKEREEINDPASERRKKYLQVVSMKAKRIVGMLQATMSLEGQALDEETLRDMFVATVRDILLKEQGG